MPSLSTSRSTHSLRPAPTAVPDANATRPQLLPFSITASHRMPPAGTQNRVEAPPAIHSRYLERALDLLCAAVVFVNEEASVLRVNQAAAVLLAQRDGLMLTQNTVYAESAKENRKLRDNIRLAAASGANGRDKDIFQQLISRTQPRPPLILAIAPVGNGTAALPEHPAAVLFVSDPETNGLPSLQALAEMYRLTPSEAELAHLLLEGKSVRDAATARNITPNTARTQLRNVFSKTSAARQSDLIRLLLRSPVLVRCERSSAGEERRR